MRTGKFLKAILAVTLSLFGSHSFAGVSDSPIQLPPPDGWDRPCSGDSVKVAVSTTSRSYTGTGSCWVWSTTIDQYESHGWVKAQVVLAGTYDLNSKKFSERLTFSGAASPYYRNDPYVVSASGACGDDPWATSATCSAATPNLVNLGYESLPSSWTPGPLTRLVFGAGVVQALLSKQESKPPQAPINLKAVRMPNIPDDGRFFGNIAWDTPDLSDNRWILQYEVEYSTTGENGAYTKAGRVIGPGMTTNIAQWQSGRGFRTSFALQSGIDYYFRVCSVNDAGRACAVSKARAATGTELLAEKSATSHVAFRGTPAAKAGAPGVVGAGPTTVLSATPARTSGSASPGTKTSGGFGAALPGRGAQNTGPTTTMSATGPASRMASPGAVAPAVKGAQSLPDPAIDSVTIAGQTYTRAQQSIVVANPQRSAADCQKPMMIPIRVVVRNIGQSDFVPRNSAQAVGAWLGNWGSATDMVRLAPNATQTFDFQASVPSGQYTFKTMIDLHHQVSEVREDNNVVQLSVEVRCDTRAMAPAPLPSMQPGGSLPIKR